MDIVRSETVEAELSRLIARRSSGEMDPDEREKLWQESVRDYTARRREEMRAAWCEYHQDQAARHRATLESLIARHKAAAARTLTKKEPAKDRQYRQPPEEDLQNEQKQTDNAVGSPDGPDSTYAEDRQYESPANSGFTDGSDDTDDDPRQHSKGDGSWQGDPMRHNGRGDMA